MEREIIGWSNERLCLMWKSCKDIYKLVGISVASVIVLKRPFIDFLLTPASKMKIGRWLRDGRPKARVYHWSQWSLINDQGHLDSRGSEGSLQMVKGNSLPVNVSSNGSQEIFWKVFSSLLWIQSFESFIEELFVRQGEQLIKTRMWSILIQLKNKTKTMLNWLCCT